MDHRGETAMTAMLTFCQAVMGKVSLACRGVSEQRYLWLYPPTSDSSQTNYFSWQLMDFCHIFSQHNLFQISCLSGPTLHPALALSNIGWTCPAATSRFVKRFVTNSSDLLVMSYTVYTFEMHRHAPARCDMVVRGLFPGTCWREKLSQPIILILFRDKDAKWSFFRLVMSLALTCPCLIPSSWRKGEVRH